MTVAAHWCVHEAQQKRAPLALKLLEHIPQMSEKTSTNHSRPLAPAPTGLEVGESMFPIGRIRRCGTLPRVLSDPGTDWRNSPPTSRPPSTSSQPCSSEPSGPRAVPAMGGWPIPSSLTALLWLLPSITTLETPWMGEKCVLVFSGEMMRTGSCVDE